MIKNDDFVELAIVYADSLCYGQCWFIQFTDKLSGIAKEYVLSLSFLSLISVTRSTH